MSAMMLTARPGLPQNTMAIIPLPALSAAINPPTRVLFKSVAVSAAVQNSPLIFSFNFGRILSYGLAGAIVGAMGGAMSGAVGGAIGSVGNTTGAWLMRDVMPIRLIIFIVANIAMLLTGLYIAGWTRGLAPLEPLERAGMKLWQKISPITNKLLPVKNIGQAALLGALWGWIPCGLVYAMLVVALASGSSVNGAASMLAFGLGTLPAMTAAGLLSAQMKIWLRHKRVRIFAGVAVMLIALIGLNRAPALVGLSNYATLTELCHSMVSSSTQKIP